MREGPKVTVRERRSETRCVRLPGFLIEQEIGLGDAIKRVAHGFGIKPCSGCEKRVARLNRWMRFSR